MRLGYSKLLGTLICDNICIYLLWTHYKKRLEKNLFDDDYAIFFSDFLHRCICCGYSFELHQQVDAIQMSTHNICVYKEVDKKYTGSNLKTTELLDCALIGVCAVIRSKTVLSIYPKYLDTLTIYHTCTKFWRSLFYYLLMCLKYFCIYGKQCRPWSDATFCGIWSGSVCKSPSAPILRMYMVKPTQICQR